MEHLNVLYLFVLHSPLKLVAVVDFDVAVNSMLTEVYLAGPELCVKSFGGSQHVQRVEGR